MFVSSKTTPAQRRGIVLVLILGMLGLLALIGVTFATFSGQARISARNFAQAQGAPDSAQLMDFALSQLIDDTYNPQSALMGHSLKRDMYGTDAAFNGYLTGRPSDNAQMLFQTSPAPTLTTLAVSNDSVKCITNIPVGDESFYGFIFDRWIVTFSTPYVSGSGASLFPVGQTFEVLHHDPNDSSGFHALYLAPPDAVTMGVRSGFVSGEPGRTAVTSSALLGETYASAMAGGNPGVPTGIPFVLDGRYLHAFNGTGMGPLAVYGDFSVNGPLLGSATMVGNPDAVGMDEDYDACDLENWFLAIQSADGKVIVPSFHRPGILRASPSDSSYGDPTYTISGAAVLNDWRNTSLDSRTRFLRNRAIDGHSPITFPDLLPNQNNGQITFDVDNDGDGNTDSVWLDLGFPAQLNAQGQLYKPLYAFKIIGLNGKIPLNTAGNLAHRDITGAATYQQASRLGYSPSEVDPTFALQNSGLQFDNSGSNGTQTANGLTGMGVPDGSIPVNLTQLRNILTGTYPSTGLGVGDINSPLPNNVYDAQDNGNVRIGTPVAGRWGESSLIPIGFVNSSGSALNYYVFNNPVRAGLSVYNTATLSSREADDDDFNTFDAYPPTSAVYPNGPESLDYYDGSGTLGMPVERERRNVTPKDIAGDGMVAQYNTFVGGASLTAPLNTGPDAWGRVSFYKYFRPPGMAPGPNYAAPEIPDVQNNLLHAFEMQRFPQTIASATARDMLLLGTMPSDLTNMGGMSTEAPVYYGGPMPTAPATFVTTFDSYINSGTADILQGATPYNTITPGVNTNVYAWYSAGFNDANEMNLYQSDGNDQAFGPTDLEWLYRLQDVDGSSLSSRLSSLAPVSLVSAGDAQRRRRLFSTDSWELSSSVWTNDNPGNVFPFNSRFPSPSFPPTFLTGNPVPNPLSNASLTSYSTQLGVYIPSAALAHRERKINLNYPLPNVNFSDEPTRQKWVLDAYRVLLSVLPPLTVDTPEEQLQLSQFLLNVVDFRDPDSTMTHFINPDYKIRPGTGPAAPATLIPMASAMTGDQPLDQYGMEYAPVAINEVLAFSYLRKDNGGNKGVGGDHGTSGTGYIDTATPRFFVELVNTLTQSASPSPANAALNTSDLDLGGGLIPGAAWDLVVAPDDVLNRPDPNTGQFHQDVTGTPVFGTTTYGAGPILLNSTSFTATGGGAGANVVLPALTSTTSPIPPAPASPPTPGNYFYVIGNQPPPIATSQPPNPEIGTQFNVDQILSTTVDPFTNYSSGSGTGTTTTVPYLTRTGTGMSKYYWLYLRRPANPFAPSTPPGYVATAAAPANPMVVVDCIRFPYIEAGSTVTNTDQSVSPDADSVTVGANDLYSVQRLQPMRGGQVVPSAITPASLDSRYGYTEQIAAPTTAGGLSFKYGSSNKTTPNKTLSTGHIYHTLQAKNDGAQSAAGSGGDRWRYLPFHDRDFTSVAELLLVPGCPPGLFTKQFIETIPTSAWVTPTPNTYPPLTRPTTAPVTLGGSTPASFPYLVDEFYYTAQDPGVAVTIPIIGGPTSAGWFKMFEFLEVPSPVIGAIGSASNGVNYDWFRQDLRPGLLNINLILDEEVFLGLVGNAGMPNVPIGPTQDVLAGQFMNQAPQSLNGIQILPVNLPKVVTLVDPTTGLPAVLPVTSNPASYNVYSFGMYDTSLGANLLKACFSDFLKLRHGASGYLFSYGTTALVGGMQTTVIPPDRPFHSLSYPDINYTLMRPAAIVADMSGMPPSPAPGLKNPTITTPSGAGVPQVMPPPIPPRRLFQIPDFNILSNASPLGDGYAFKELATSALTANLYNTNVDLTNPAAEFGTVAGDRRPHPYYRSEWMQRVTNLTTVRTHQYAVWITIGLFQVTTQGDPSLVNDPNYFTLAQDKIGTEIGLLSGETTRYRSFFIIDRTKAVGFNPQNPGDFHSVIVYRNDIE